MPRILQDNYQFYLQSALPGIPRQIPTKVTFSLIQIGLANTKWPHRVPVHALYQRKNEFYW
jgi:hypothetical protein